MNEGHLGKFKASGERAATDDHPVIMHVLLLDESVVAPLAVGTLLKKVTQETTGEAKYALATENDMPCAVVDVPCDPTGEHGETSAKCVVHGTVKARLLTVGDVKASLPMIDKLQDKGIFAI